MSRIRSAVVALVMTPAVASAQIAASHFTSGFDGWVTGDLFGGCCGPAGWVPAGGNPGGFVRTPDLFSWNAYWAPGAFVGGLSGAYGGSLSFSMRIQSSDGVQYPNVVIHSGAGLIQYVTSPPPNNVWTNFNIGMTEAGWQIGDGFGGSLGAVSQAMFQNVLASATSLRIEADWQTGNDLVDLDEVILNGDGHAGVVPEPASVVLLATGLAGVFAARRRARR